MFLTEILSGIELDFMMICACLGCAACSSVVSNVLYKYCSGRLESTNCQNGKKVN